MSLGILSILVMLPLMGAVAVMLVPEGYPKVVKALAMGFSLAAFAVSLGVLARFQGGTYHMQMVEQAPWVPSLGISYKVGIDGISLWLVVLTTFLNIIAVWFSFYVTKRVKTYFAMTLFLLSAMLGVFVSLDMILFYTFFEASLIPMAVLIWIWGGQDRNYAAVKFFIYTFAASVLFLVGMIALAQQYRAVTGVLSFDLVAIQSTVANGKLWAGALQLQTILFWSFALAFMVKCPMFPFHTWLPLAHTEAPTAGSVILAGVLLKMGTYGFLRFVLPLFPEAVLANTWLIAMLSVVGIIYGAAVAAVQPDVKKLVAYSSVAHMGFVMLGIFSLNHAGIMGGAYQQLNHGISTGALFLMVGLLYERIHTRLFADMGGLKKQMPVFSALFLIVMLSSVGLPGLNGFIGEFLALYGSFQSGSTSSYGLNPIYPILAGLGVVLAAVYLLWMFQKVFYGELNPKLARLKDLKAWEVAMVGCLVVFMFWGGIYPNTFLKPMEKSVNAVRMMVLHSPGMRPTWDDLTTEVDDDGSLVTVEPRQQNSMLEPYVVVRKRTDSGHYFQVATQADAAAPEAQH